MSHGSVSQRLGIQEVWVPVALVDLLCCWRPLGYLRSKHLIAQSLQPLDEVVRHPMPIHLLEELHSLYVKLRTSPLDTGPEQAIHLLREQLNRPGKGLFLHTA